MMMWWGGGNWIWGTLMMIGVWGSLAALCYFALRTMMPSRPRARDVLDERFARGELSEDEYRRTREMIERPTAAHAD